MKFELDLSNYATKSGLKNATDIDTSKFPRKVNLANLKSKVDNLDIDKLKTVPPNLRNLESKVNKLDNDNVVPVPADLCKLSDAVKNDTVKKDVENGQIKNIEDKIPVITNLATDNILNPKISEAKYLEQNREIR